MSADIGAELALRNALLQALQGDAAIQRIFGHPARLYDRQTSGSTYPYLEISRHRSEDAGSDEAPALEHRIDIEIITRRDLYADTDTALGEIRRVLDTVRIQLSGFNLVLLFPVFSDSLHLRDGRTIRATMRLRAITEPLRMEA